MFEKMIQKIRLSMFDAEKSLATHKGRVKLEREQTRAKLEHIYDEICDSVPLKSRAECPEMTTVRYTEYARRVTAYRRQVFLHSVVQVIDRLERLEASDGGSAFERMGF